MLLNSISLQNKLRIISYLRSLSSPYKSGQESQPQAAANRNSKCVKETIHIGYINVGDQVLYLC
jgi:hypothetical protein